ncbi:Minf_1886 family protein [Luteolibacter algae]|uniref:Minf_1886 family protein n=1 Tax=Luteolibacter algae TaxID=454151 RepID=A0ABW5DBW4_9BACT
MQPIHFEESVASILQRESRYDGQAYFFLKDALDFTLKRFMESSHGKGRHVSGEELLGGFRDFAIEQFGPMAVTLMEEWGVNECRDIGNMVFRMIEEQVFGKQDSDKPEDFEGSFDLKSALREPFEPKGVRNNIKSLKSSGTLAS